MTGDHVDDDPSALPLPLLVGTLDVDDDPTGLPLVLGPHDAALAGVIPVPPAAPADGLVSRRELLGLVRELRQIDDRMPAEAREGLLARKRAMIDRLDPDFYDAEVYGPNDLDLDDAAAVARWELDADLEASELLEDLAAGRGGESYPGVEPPRRAEPNTPEWTAEIEQFQALHAAAVKALDDLELECALLSGSFPDSLREVLEDVARRRGGSEALVETRPGSWEADNIRHLTCGVDYELDRELEQFAAPVADGAPESNG